MKKTNNFFVIDNFNTVPIDLVEYCHDYMIYDASIEKGIEEKLIDHGFRYKKIDRTGHNLSTYFRFFYENYENLPEVMCLTKGHMIGRHCSKEFFDRVYDNKYFTYLYEDKQIQNDQEYHIRFLAMENQYLERNNSWYVESDQHPHKYFIEFNDLLRFIYKNPVIPAYCIFAPGGEYIVRKEHVLKHSRTFYINLNKIMTYGLNPNFPVEAHMIERMMPIIFQSNYEENIWMDSEVLFDEKLAQLEKRIVSYDHASKNRKKIKHFFLKLWRPFIG